MSGRRQCVVLAAGGTGGHLFPAESLAGELMRRDFHLVLVTDRRGAAFEGPLGELETHRVHAAGLSGHGVGRKAAALAQLGLGTLEAVRLMRRLSPAAAVGFGGYASLPTMLAASLYGAATVIHEQNAVLGRANRLLAPRADKIATSFAEVSHIAPAHRHTVIRPGNRVLAGGSRDAQDRRHLKAKPASANGFDDFLGRSVITERLSCRVDTRRDRRVRYDPAPPDLLHDFVMSDHAPRVGTQ